MGLRTGTESAAKAKTPANAWAGPIVIHMMRARPLAWAAAIITVVRLVKYMNQQKPIPNIGRYRNNKVSFLDRNERQATMKRAVDRNTLFVLSRTGANRAIPT